MTDLEMAEAVVAGLDTRPWRSVQGHRFIPDVVDVLLYLDCGHVTLISEIDFYNQPPSYAHFAQCPYCEV